MGGLLAKLEHLHSRLPTLAWQYPERVPCSSRECPHLEQVTSSWLRPSSPGPSSPCRLPSWIRRVQPASHRTAPSFSQPRFSFLLRGLLVGLASPVLLMGLRPDSRVAAAFSPISCRLPLPWAWALEIAAALDLLNPFSLSAS